jgi:uncharacterized phage infection (PIP) family protein YhgE
LSPLTKLFVGLHVILSAMLVAGVIVFVNTQQKWKDATTTAQAQAQQAKTDLNALTEKYTADIGTYKANEATLQGAINTYKANLANAQQKNNEQAASLADQGSKMALQGAENTKLAEAIKASQDAQSKLNEAVASLRKDADTRLAESTQLNSRISDLTNQLDVTERERRFLAEQLTQARADNDTMSNQLKALGLEPEMIAAAGAKVGPPINGVVRNIDNIAGNMYATISVGSVDSVAKGMQFNVVERGSGKFLGVLTVTAVEANESSGRVTGPNVKDIRPDTAEVKTQL